MSGLGRFLAGLVAMAALAVGWSLPASASAAPAVLIAPHELDFRETGVGETAGPLVATVKNVGSEQLGPLIIASTNTENFVYDTTECGSRLDPGEECEIEISFKPVSEGLKEGWLEVFDTGSGVHDSVTVKGVGTAAPVVRFSPASAEFDPVLANEGEGSEIFIVENVGIGTLSINSIGIGGEDAADFAVASSTCGATLAPGSSCQVDVRFRPAAAGFKWALLELTTNSELGVDTAAISGFAEVSAPLEVKPGNADFGSGWVGKYSGSETFRVQNTGLAAATVSSIAVETSGAPSFSIESDDCSGVLLEPGETCEFAVEFEPQAEGPVEGTAKVYADVLADPLEVALKGEGELVPDILSNPTQRNFGQVGIGRTGGPRTLEIKSIGSKALTIGNLEISGADAASFSFTDNCSGRVIQPGASCNVFISFRPTAERAYEATLEIHSDAPLHPTTEVPLTGTGVPPPGQRITPNTINFGLVDVGTEPGAKITVESTGVAPLEILRFDWLEPGQGPFYVRNNSCGPFGTPLQSGEKCEIEIAFEAWGLLYHDVEFEIVTNAGSERVWIIGEAENLPDPKIAIAPTSWTYPGVAVGSAGEAKTFVLQNTGEANLNVDQITVTGADADDFDVQSGLCPGIELVPDAVCQFTVQVKPNAVGPIEATLKITSDARNDDELEVQLQGEGLANPVIEIDPASWDFGAAAIGSTAATKRFAVENTGTTAMQIDETTLTGAGATSFAVETDSCDDATLDPGEECGVVVAFVPDATGEVAATLAVASDAVSGDEEVDLSGEGTAPVAAISPASHDFGEVIVGEDKASEEFAIENTGTAPLAVEGLEIGGPGAAQFELDAAACEGAELDPGETCTLEATFAPTATGPATAAIELETDGFEADPTAALEGEGVTAVRELSVEPAAWDFGAVKVGGSGSAHVFTVENTGNRPIIPAAVDLEGAAAASFAVPAESCVGATLEPGNTCAVTVNFAPSSAGSKQAQMTIGSEQGGVTPARATLSGSGTEEQGGGGGGNEPAPPVCTPIDVTRVVPFRPTSPKEGARTVLGLRARLSTDAARAAIDVSASIAFRTSGGKSRTVSLGSSSVRASGGAANYKVAIPANLRRQLPFGAKVTLKLRYSAQAVTSDCSSSAPTTQRSNLRTSVVWVSL